MVAVARWGKSCQSSSINCPSSDLSDVWWTSTRQKKFIRHCSLYFTYKETISPRAVPLTVVLCWQSLTWAKVGQTLLTQMFLEWVGFCGMEHSTQHWQLFENKMKIKTITPENMNSRKKMSWISLWCQPRLWSKKLFRTKIIFFSCLKGLHRSDEVVFRMKLLVPQICKYFGIHLLIILCSCSLLLKIQSSGSVQPLSPPFLNAVLRNICMHKQV